MDIFKFGLIQKGIIKNVKNHINEMLKDEDISEGQFEYFIVIYQNEGINQNDLSKKLDVGKASVTKAMKKLLSSGLVKRIINDNDNRNYGLFISGKGQHYISVFNNISKELNKKMFADFTEDEIEVLVKLMNKSYDNSCKL